MKTVFFLFLTGILLPALLTAGCTAPQVGPVTPGITAPVASPGCGFTTCHGLDLACGTDPPQACTAIYQIGDKCRQYAYCTGAEGSCALVRTPEFDRCKACIEQCGGADATEISICEEKC